MFIEETQAQAARKAAMSFHKRHGVKSLNEIAPHTLTWGNLNALQSDVAKQARATLDRAETADDTEAKNLEVAHDGFMAFHDVLEAEKDERGVIGNKGPRPQAETRAQLSMRPQYDPASSGTEARADDAYALAPEQRMTTWAAARSAPMEELRGMTPGSFLRAMVSENKSEQERRALAIATDSAGGYTVPVELSSMLIDAARANSVCIAAGAQTIPLTSNSNQIAKVASDPVPAWRAESGAVAESDPTFGIIDLTPQSLAVRVDISAELMQDTLNLETMLPQILTSAMAVEMDRAALEGSGTAPEPKGILNTSGINTIPQGAASTSYANLLAARTAILSGNRGPASAFILSPREEGVLYGLTNGNSDPLGIPMPVANVPWFTTTSIDDARGTGSDESTIYCGNFQHLLMGIRQDIQVEVIKGPRYVSNLELTLVAHMRFDCAVEDPKAFTTITGVGDAA